MGVEHSLWLAAGLGYGAGNSGELFGAFGGAQAVYANLASAIQSGLCTPAQAKRLRGTQPADFAGAVEQSKAMGLTLLAWEDDAYPALLRHIASPPPVLFCKGDISLLNGRLCIGMVGTRRPSAYGIEAVKTVGGNLAAAGAVIVSGLAAGLDAEGHKAALAANAPTIACIAFGHDFCYPSANRRLMETIAGTGLVVGEYPPGVEPEKVFFLQRNRLIAGISNGLLVTEARVRSGTMSTVNFAAEYGRDIFAIPGSIFSNLSAGTNALLREGALLATGAEDILSHYTVVYPPQADNSRPAPAMVSLPAWLADAPKAEPTALQLALEGLADKEEATAAPKREELPPPVHLGGAAETLYGVLTPLPQSLADLCDASGLTPQAVLSATALLEMEGYCEQLAGRRFRTPQ